MAINRGPFNALVDDDGSNTVGSIWNKAAIAGVLLDPTDAALLATVVPRTDTGTVTDWAPGLSGTTLIQWSGVSNLAVNTLAGGVRGQTVIFKNIGGAVASFAHMSGAGLATNRFYNLAKSAATPVAPDGWATWVHDGNLWNLIDHEQGAWITPAYSAANFTALAPMTWTVDAADVTAYTYRLSGRTLSVVWFLDTTTVGGTGTSQLRLKVPGGFLVAKDTVTFQYASDAGAPGTAGYVVAGPNTPNLLILCRDATTNTNWTVAANLTYARGTITFEVT